MRFLIIFFTVFLFAKEYSIQIFTAKKLNPVLKIYQEFKDYPYARIEKIGDFYTLRVYRKSRVKYLKPYLKEIKKRYKSAFIRSIKWIDKRIVYPKKKGVSQLKKRDIKFLNTNLKIEKPVKNIFELLPKKRGKKLNVMPKKNEVVKPLKLPLYTQLSLDLLKNDKESISFLIKKYDKKLPFRDKFVGLLRLKRVSEAKEVAFQNLKNSDEYRTYKQIRDFYMEYGDRFKIENRVVTSNDISYFAIKSRLKYYLFKGYYGYFEDESYFPDKYSNMNILKVGVKRILNKGYNYFEVGKKGSDLLFLFKNQYPSKYYQSTFYIGKERADESNYLLFNAEKRFLKEHLLFYLTNRNIIETSLSLNRYFDDKFLGNGVILNLKYIRKLRVKYPDWSYYVFANFNQFSKNKNLPQSSYEGGIGYFFGLDQRDIYHHSIIPFLDTYLTYNAKFGTALNLFLGASGRLYRQDNFSAGLKYSQSLAGTPYLEYLLNYIFWF